MEWQDHEVLRVVVGRTSVKLKPGPLPCVQPQPGA